MKDEKEMVLFHPSSFILHPSEEGGRGVAVRWRIRHKLMLGLGLVVGIIALLLAGTIYGLSKFRATMRSIDGEQEELRQAECVRDAVNNLKMAWDRMTQPGQRTPPNIQDV